MIKKLFSTLTTLIFVYTFAQGVFGLMTLVRDLRREHLDRKNNC